MEVITGIALAAPAGLNAYVPLLAVALAERFGLITLRDPFGVLGQWWVIAIIAVLLVIEVVADKVPAVDHVNDAVQTVVRPAAGGLLAVAASGAAQVDPWVFVVVGVVLAGGVHAAKASARPVVNAATAGAGAPVVSTAEDIGAAGLTLLAFVAPLLTLVLVAVLIGLVVWAVARFRRGRAARR